MDDLFVDWHALAGGCEHESRPLMLVDLSSVAGDFSAVRFSPNAPALPGWRLPSCPVIGVGDAGHPLAHRLDAVVEPPFSLSALVASIESNPQAAAVVVQLLRGLEGQDTAAALVQESMAYGLLQGGGEHAAWLAARQPRNASIGTLVSGGRPGNASVHSSGPLGRLGDASVHSSGNVSVPPPGRLLLERLGDRLILTIDRPAARNAIDRPLRDSLREAFELASLDCDLTTLHLRSTGKAFCIGADLSEFGTTRDPVVAHAIRMKTLPAHAIIGCRDRLSVHIQGGCIGAGLEMAAFASRITAAASAWFQLPELAMGLLPGAGGCVSVSQRIGRKRAALLILSRKRIDAAMALRWGLIDAIMDDEAANDRCTDILR